tara:strand:+ start:7255 stop:8199 length:945 start_codon:yes stop_codon:yes gene_type:complete
MAVYTKISKENLENFLSKYDLGSLIYYKGIIQGIENTNYKIITDKGTYILTLFEKRVKSKDLPFFINLQKHLSKCKFSCPIPIEDNNKKIINQILNKEAIIVSFLNGLQINKPKPIHCFQVGEMLSKIQKITKNFKLTRKNSLSIGEWKKIFQKCSNISSNKFDSLIATIKEELIYLEKNWPLNLPKGIIHCDVFKDNVFFKENKLTGLIDFYFSCNDFYSYDLALATNDWCFDKEYNFNIKNFEFLIKGYETFYNLGLEEKKYFNILLRGAAIRILVTRLHDLLFHIEGTKVIPKNPFEYYEILKWHQTNKIF